MNEIKICKIAERVNYRSSYINSNENFWGVVHDGNYESYVSDIVKVQEENRIF